MLMLRLRLAFAECRRPMSTCLRNIHPVRREYLDAEHTLRPAGVCLPVEHTPRLN